MGFPRQEYWSGLLCPPPENIFCKMRLLRKRTGLTAWIHPQYCPVPQASVRPGLKCPAHLFFLVVFLPLLLGHQASHWPLSALPRGPVWLLRVPCPDTPTGAVIIIFQKLVRVSSHLHVLGAPPFLRLQTRALATAPKLQELAELTLPRAAPDVSPPLSTLSHSPFPSWGCCLGNAPRAWFRVSVTALEKRTQQTCGSLKVVTPQCQRVDARSSPRKPEQLTESPQQLAAHRLLSTGALAEPWATQGSSELLPNMDQASSGVSLGCLCFMGTDYVGFTSGPFRA